MSLLDKAVAAVTPESETTARPEGEEDGAATGGSLPQAPVEDRPDVAPVRPEDYPEADRAKGA